MYHQGVSTCSQYNIENSHENFVIHILVCIRITFMHIFQVLKMPKFFVIYLGSHCKIECIMFFNLTLAATSVYLVWKIH